jgi:hypothetical protein
MLLQRCRWSRPKQLLGPRNAPAQATCRSIGRGCTRLGRECPRRSYRRPSPPTRKRMGQEGERGKAKTGARGDPGCTRCVHPPRASPRLASPRGPAAPSYAAQSTFRDSPWEGRSCRAKGRCPAWRQPAPPPRAGTEPKPLPQQGAWCCSCVRARCSCWRVAPLGLLAGRCAGSGQHLAPRPFQRSRSSQLPHTDHHETSHY